jgi:response regulator NasT
VKPFQKKDLLPTIEMAMSRYTELLGLEAEVDDLQARLEARKLVERAKGVLMSEHAMSEPEAFRWIQRTSMNKRLTMRALAEAILDGSDRPADNNKSND